VSTPDATVVLRHLAASDYNGNCLLLYCHVATLASGVVTVLQN